VTEIPERLHRIVDVAEVFAEGMPAPLTKCRVFVTNRRIIVWATDDENLPGIVLERQVTEEVERDRGSLFGQLHVQTPEGQVHVSRGRGCCNNSALAALTPPVTW